MVQSNRMELRPDEIDDTSSLPDMNTVDPEEGREDGKLDLSLRDKAYLQMEPDAQAVMKALEEFDGVLPFNDKASPQVILREFGMSKNAFKRAVGHLLKEGRVRITGKTIEKV